MTKLGTVGVIGRFKPLHNGGAVMLETLCENADLVKIGIGSSNRYNARNPFTAEESKEMIDRLLSKKYSNYEFIFVQDFGHIPEYSDGQKWKQSIVEQYGKLDCFVTGNEYVASLLESNYKIIHPGDLIPEDKQVRLRATEVRVEMARFGDWKKLVPNEVSDYLEANGLVERFKKEFGLETLAKLAENENLSSFESKEKEKSHVINGV